MSPEIIPWLMCSGLCILPLLIGTGAYYFWIFFTNKIPTRNQVNYIDDDGRKHTITEWVMLSRKDKKELTRPEELE